MSNAAKHRKKAAEFEQLKQIDRAIASYIKAIEESESGGEDVDVALLNKVGDLTLRQGRIADAVTYYERAVEHYATAGLFNNAIALCNKILRSAPGRANVYFTLGRICAKKGLRGDATRNFLEYATRMQQEGRVEEGMRALAEVADLMPELTEVRRLVEEHAERVGIALPRRRTPMASQPAQPANETGRPDDKSSELIFLDVGMISSTRRNTPPLSPRVPTPVSVRAQSGVKQPEKSVPTPANNTPAASRPLPSRTASTANALASLDAFLLFDPSRPELESAPAATSSATASATTSAKVVEAVATEIEAELPETVEFLAEPMVAPVAEVAIEPVIDRAVEPTIETPVAPAHEAELSVELLPEPAIEWTTVPAVEEASATPDASSTENAVASPTSAAELFGDEATAAHALGEVHVEQLKELHATHEVNDANTLQNNTISHVEGLTSVVDSTPALIDMTGEISSTQAAQVDGLEVMGEFEELAGHTLDGLTSDEFGRVDDESLHVTEPAVTWLVPADVTDGVSTAAGLEATHEADADLSESVDVLSDLVIEDFENEGGDALDVAVISADIVVEPQDLRELTADARRLTPLDVSPIPELDAAIEAGALAAALAESDPEIALRRPPFRIDPHDFILPGELPPLMVDDALIAAVAPSSESAVETELWSVSDVVEPVALTSDQSSTTLPDDLLDEQGDESGSLTPLVTPAYTAALPEESVESTDSGSTIDQAGSTEVESAESQPVVATASAPASSPDADIDSAAAEAALRATIERATATPLSTRSVSTTPSLPIAAVAAEANAVASSRRDELQAAVAQAPHDWVLRRRLAEAMFEVGDREGGLAELQTALMGFSQGGHFGVAADIADELLRISPERISYHQKRVELAVRLNDQQRLRVAYLDLGDILSTGGDEVRAHAVYARVLEIDPWDERARAALGAAAPPPPPKATPDDEQVDLTSWLRDDGPDNTRMRMREPEVSGDEQADFDALLRHFKDGVARSLGEEDYESHYDLGVAYKEMGLTDDAIAEFQKALRSRRHRLPAYEALGQCFVEQSRYSIAATVLTRALHEPGLGDENRVGVLYLLAYSCEALQRWDEARSYYTRVYATDINFRDAAARLAALDQLAR